MILYYIRLDITGDRLSPKKLISKLTNNLKVLDYHSIDDIYERTQKRYGYGTLSLIHPDGVSLENGVDKYQEVFVDFLKSNNQVISESGGNEVCIWLNIYLDGNFGNISLFNKNALKVFGNSNVSLNMDIYNFSKERILNDFSEYLPIINQN